MEHLLGDIEDIAPQVGSRSKAYELLAQGKFRAVKIGTRTRVDMQSFRDYVATLPPATFTPPKSRKQDEAA